VFIELIDLLRCVEEHEDTWLVASFETVSNRFVLDASLGCPSCSAHYPIRDGVADFSAGQTTASCDKERGAASHRREELATRAGAYLNATQPGATIVLGGLWAYAAQELAEMADVRVIALNAPNEVKESSRVALVQTATRIPLAPESVHGVALDAWFPVAMTQAAWRAVKPGGRVVGPTSFDPPADSTVLAHDDSYWVAEKLAQLVSLERSKPSA
jgi:uncharacterized protein YbaR (Trm112 family)